MSCLRIESAVPERDDRLTLQLIDAGKRLVAETTKPAALDDADERDIRWYLEEFLFWPASIDGGPIADRIKQIGADAFEEVFLD